MDIKVPRLVIAGLAGDSGKTIVTLSLLAALRKKALSISVFKKGPDYIDAAWLSYCSGAICRNLDSYLVDPSLLLNRFSVSSVKSDISVIEGNRGLYDGKDIHGTHSTAQLAKLFKAPIILVIDCTKMTRTVAALVKGCIDFDPDANIAGLILNNVAGERHQQILADSIKRYCGIPILGSIPKLKEKAEVIPGRHLGLIPPAEFDDGHELIERLRKIADNYLDIEELISTAKSAGTLSIRELSLIDRVEPIVKIGYFKDSVFTFYYPENLEALESNGAELVAISSLKDKRLPDLDALYIGGGFPETHAEELAQNRSLMKSIKVAAISGLPIYAECGGLIYLCNSLRWKNRKLEMAGLFPVDLEMCERPVGHGYSELEVTGPNAFYEIGTTIKGHEFHYSRPIKPISESDVCMTMLSGTGLGNRHDGLVLKNSLACFTHIHADGVGQWASSLVMAALNFKNSSRRNDEGNFSSANRKNTVAA